MGDQSLPSSAVGTLIATTIPSVAASIDHSPAAMERVAVEICESCRAHAQLRDEVYLQLMKQLSRNPDYTSVTRGQKLLARCIGQFLPSEGLFYMVAVFARQRFPSIYPLLFSEASEAYLLASSEHNRG